MTIAHYCFNEDGFELAVHFFKNRTNSFYKSIRQQKFDPQKRAQYDELLQQVLSNMSSLGFNQSQIYQQEIDFWSTVGRYNTLDFLPGFELIPCTWFDESEYASLKELVPEDLIYINKMILEEHRRSQKKWCLCIKAILEHRCKEKKEFEQLEPKQEELLKIFVQGIRGLNPAPSEWADPPALSSEVRNSALDATLDETTSDFFRRMARIIAKNPRLWNIPTPTKIFDLYRCCMEQAVCKLKDQSSD